MDNILKEALNYYEIKYPQFEFIRHNENQIYKVKDTIINKYYVVRIHKPSKDFSLDIFENSSDYVDLITSEMDIINSMNKNSDIAVQVPMRNKCGDFVSILSDGTPVTVLSWINGITIDKVELTDDILYEIGEMLGKFHKFSKAWDEWKSVKRYSYDRMLLQKMSLKIEEGIESKVISNEQYRIIKEVIKEIRSIVEELDLQKNSKGLVHSDLAKSNLIINEKGEIIPIDFGLSGNSHYYMDLGSVFSHFKELKQQNSIISGYRSIINEPIKVKYIEAFMVFQCILFISTHIKNAYEYKWFSKAIDKWSKELFKPLINGEQFIELKI